MSAVRSCHDPPNFLQMISYIPDQSIYKCLYELKCEPLAQIQSEVLEWVKQETNFLEDRTSRGFWHKIDYKSMAKVCPSLLRYMNSIKIPIREIVIGLLTESMTNGFVLHNGAPPYNFKINFPIYNTEDVYTEWYDISLKEMEKFPTWTNPHTKTEQYDFEWLHTTVQDLYPCLTRYNMHNNPIIFNSYIPHRVMPGPNAKYPRIMIACMPFRDPVEYMLK